jgi:hypothetical protein
MKAVRLEDPDVLRYLNLYHEWWGNREKDLALADTQRAKLKEIEEKTTAEEIISIRQIAHQKISSSSAK